MKLNDSELCSAIQGKAVKVFGNANLPSSSSACELIKTPTYEAEHSNRNLNVKFQIPLPLLNLKSDTVSFRTSKVCIFKIITNNLIDHYRMPLILNAEAIVGTGEQSVI